MNKEVMEGLAVLGVLVHTGCVPAPAPVYVAGSVHPEAVVVQPVTEAVVVSPAPAPVAEVVVVQPAPVLIPREHYPPYDPRFPYPPHPFVPEPCVMRPPVPPHVPGRPPHGPIAPAPAHKPAPHPQPVRPRPRGRGH